MAECIRAGTWKRLLIVSARFLLGGLAVVACGGSASAADGQWTLRGGSTEDLPFLAAGLERDDVVERLPVSPGTLDRFAGSIEAAPPVRGAAPTPHAPKPLVRYRVYDQSLGDVLETLSKLTGVPVVFQSSIDGRVRAETLSGSLGSIVAQLSGRFGFFYAFDGARFIVSSHEKTVTEVTEVPEGSFDEAVALMGKVFPAVSPGSVRISRDLGVVMLRGPEAFVQAERTALSFNKVDHVKIIRGGYSSIVKLGDDPPALPPSK
ncbi:hypothetical protein ASG54_08490 [Aureimonas sp. Leaf460]|nr:hypothetical protein ASG62_24215 [Aureimonas sp. Leaf427]KQT79592.1 hypothetical protein ASG54_08490 [Aureimonas sp. Leaf460]